MKKVTAVVPAGSSLPQMNRCLSALCAGRYVPEIVVVAEDGSAGGRAQRIRKKWPSATVLSLPARTGFAHAANAGLRLVRTEYAFLIRPDLQPGRNCVGRLLEAVQRDRVFCAIPAFQDFFEGSDGSRRRSADVSRHDRGRAAHRTLAVPDGCAMYRMQALEEIGWLDERHYDGLEAFDLSLRGAMHGYRSLQVPGARIRRNVPAGTAGAGHGSGADPGMLRRQLAAGNSRYVLYKEFPGPQRAAALPVFAAAQAVQRKSFLQRGEEEAYRMAAERGRTLCALERERRAFYREGVTVYAETLSDASFLGMGEKARRLYPLFVAERESWRVSRIPVYAEIHRLLMREFPQVVRVLSGSD